jgi:hypothetical protein
MTRALDSGDGMCSFVHSPVSLLLTTPRPGLRALDREADPVAGYREADAVAGWRVIPRRRARAADGTRSVADERRLHAPRARRYRSAPSRDPQVPVGAIRHIAVKIVREIREQSGSAAGKPEGDDRKRASICSVAPRLAIYLLM